MNVLLLLLLTLEHVVVGLAYLAATSVGGVLAVWQASIYRRIDRATGRAR